MFSTTISPYSDHNVYLSRPVCQKMVEIWFFKFKYHSICRHNGAASGGKSRSDNFGHFDTFHFGLIIAAQLWHGEFPWNEDCGSIETCSKPGIIGVQSPTFAKYRKCPTNQPGQVLLWAIFVTHLTSTLSGDGKHYSSLTISGSWPQTFLYYRRQLIQN